MKTLRNFGYFNLLVGFALFYYSFFIGYLALLPLGLVFLALAWAYRNRPLLSPGRQAWLGLLPALGITLGLTAAGGWASRPFRQTVLVPAGYRGLVVIGYDAPTGQPKVWDEDGRLIRVSSHGLAVTQFSLADQGDIAPENDTFYTVSATGQRTLLPKFKAFFLPPPLPTTLGVYHTYLDGGPDLMVCVIARADSISHYQDAAGYVLRPTYARRAKAIADSLVPDQFPKPPMMVNLMQVTAIDTTLRGR